jgi:GxxExxY protein
MLEDEISYLIRGSIFKVYIALGPGLFESVYVAALAYELKKQGLNYYRLKADRFGNLSTEADFG